VSIKLIPIENGWMSCDTAIMCEGGEGRSSFPVCCWIIEHEKGLVLFDSGFHPNLLNDIGRIGSAGTLFDIDIPEEHDLRNLLNKKGISCADIDYLVMSHLHFDHCGGTVQVPNARIIVQKEEWEAGTDPKFVEAGVYNPDDFDLGHNVQKIEGQHDIFGDNTVVCIPTPGHTAGHQSLRVELASGPVVLTSDCAYWQEMLDDMLVPPHGFDCDQQKRSMNTLNTLRAEGCQLIFGHDAKQWLSLDGRNLI
jgi:N-acyl homoserine lactone hydrolase